jgi:hypothetical protein
MWLTGRLAADHTVLPTKTRLGEKQAKLEEEVKGLAATEKALLAVERVSIEISKAKTKKDAWLELEMTRPVTAAASTSLRSFWTYLLIIPAQRAQLRTRRGRRRRVWASNHRL